MDLSRITPICTATFNNKKAALMIKAAQCVGTELHEFRPGLPPCVAYSTGAFVINR